MEYLLVRFKERRKVIVDGEYNGWTEELIELEAGTHTISLAPPNNFKPLKEAVTLRDTDTISPMEVKFVYRY